MIHTSYFLLIISLLFLLACRNDDDAVQMTSPPLPTGDSLYFPAINTDEWESSNLSDLAWDSSALPALCNFLEQNNSRAFIILKDGKIVIEKYWGKNILETADFDKNTNWYWASAGKTLTALLVGIAQENGLLNIENKTSDYLGSSWTSMPKSQEDKILIKHQLSMTTGLDYAVSDIHCTDPGCLKYRKDPGEQWYYHNAPYTLLNQVVTAATNLSYDDFTARELYDKTGMNGAWIPNGYNLTHWSTARSAARFGLLMLNKGKWDDDQILNDTTYFNNIVSSSQSLNPSYGYLTWLNGKSSVIFPGLPVSFNITLSENAPGDAYAAMGKDGQFIVVSPSKNLVVIRMGKAPDNSLVPVKFHNDMWEYINAVVD